MSRPDPRKSDKVKYYDPNHGKKDESEGGQDPFAMIGMLLAVAGTFMKMPIFSWAALFTLTFSFINRKYKTQDLMNTATGTLFAITGLVMGYFAPPVPK